MQSPCFGKKGRPQANGQLEKNFRISANPSQSSNSYVLEENDSVEKIETKIESARESLIGQPRMTMIPLVLNGIKLP